MAKKRKKYKDISIEEIEKAVKEVFKPSITHHEWEEDGKKYSAWTIKTGRGTISTGDGGMELFMEALKKKGLSG